MAEDAIKETKDNKIEIPEAKDPMTREEADKVIVLVKLDRAKLVVQRERFLAMAAKCDVAIAEQDQAVADLERRVVGVAYPEAEKAEAPKDDAAAIAGACESNMGAPVGPTEEGK